ncbi:MAG: thermostable hemolysin [Methylophagaceae bacterium]
MEAQQIQTGTLDASERKKRLLVSHMPIRFDAEPSVEKTEINNHIKKCFAETYAAKVETFEPYILSTYNDSGITATIGFQPAASKKPLFLERYLTKTIEDTLAGILNQEVERHDIVEVGNLSSIHKGSASRVLFILSVAVLHQAGFKWVTFTATKQVQRLLGKLNLVTQPICEADPLKLADDGKSWGSYYADKPTVVVGNLTNAIAQLRSHDVIGSILNNYQDAIKDIAKKIKI